VSKSQRTKGKVGEREAAALLRELFPEAARTISQARGAEDCDVGGTPYFCEIKVGAKPAPLKALRQAKGDAKELGDERPPLVMCREDRRGWTVTMDWSTFATLVREGQAARAVAVQMAAPAHANALAEYEASRGAGGPEWRTPEAAEYFASLRAGDDEEDDAA
jgi:hypothetical protein